MDFKTKKDWQNKIQKIKKEIETTRITIPGFIHKRILINIIQDELFEKLKAFKDKKIGILFSGGVDSSTLALISKKIGLNFKCYTVGFQDTNTKEPSDIVSAKKIAKEYDFNIKIRLFNKKEIEEILKKTAKVLQRNKMCFDVVNLGVGAVEYAALELAKKDNCEVIFSGLGSEEIFAGYQRHELSNNIQEECWKGLMKMYDRDLIREMLLEQHFNIKVYAPFLDEDIIRTAMQIPGKYKLNKKSNKIPMRAIAKRIGLKEFKRKKIAAQYGSRFNNAIEKLAKQKDFKTKKDYMYSLVK